MVTEIEPPSKICIAASAITNGGRGVFAHTAITKDELIERCPTVTLAGEHDRTYLRKTELVNYYFLQCKNNHVSLCLGYGSIYNHSFTPNAEFRQISEHDVMEFYALRDITPGEEILVNYNGDPADTSRLLVPGIPPEAGGPLPEDQTLWARMKRRVRIYLQILKS